MRKKLAILLTVALFPLSGAVACGQAVEDRVRDEVNNQVDKGKQRANEEIEKGKKKLQKEAGKAQKRIQEGAKNAQKQAKEKVGGGQ